MPIWAVDLNTGGINMIPREDVLVDEDSEVSLFTEFLLEELCDGDYPKEEEASLWHK